MDWTRWEHQWYERSAQHLTSHLSLALDMHNFIEQVATDDQIVNVEMTEARKLERNLLRRLGEEYRAVDMLATNGHGFQAMSTCATLFEVAHTLGYVANNEGAATEWFTSNNRERVPWGIRTLVDRNGTKLGWDETRRDEEYGRYGFLCGFKHHNPVFSRILNLPIDADLYCAQFALAEGANLGLAAVTLVAMVRFNAETLGATLQITNSLFARTGPLMPRIDQILPPDN
jgi:hypothetical protein